MEAQVWDTPGKERYRGVMGAYYGGAHGVVLVYDSTKAQTFENLEGWIRDLKEHNVKDAVMMIVGNKCDLSQLRYSSSSDKKIINQIFLKYLL
jgi:small GTP-binding protein